MLKWNRGLIEVVLIALGVLLGLSAEAWLGNLGERRREREYLDDLRAEVETNRELLSTIMRDARRRQEVGESLLSASARGGGALDSVSSGDVIFVFQLNPIRPQTAATEQLISSGEISLIRDAGVRTAVAHWARVAAGSADLQPFQRAHWTEVTQAMLMEQGDFGAFYEIYAERDIDGLEFDLSSVVATEAFRDAVGVRLIDGQDVIYVLETLMTPSLDRLDEALANVGH